jgi:hypothetical protein
MTVTMLIGIVRGNHGRQLELIPQVEILYLVNTIRGFILTGVPGRYPNFDGFWQGKFR